MMMHGLTNFKFINWCVEIWHLCDWLSLASYGYTLMIFSFVSGWKSCTIPVGLHPSISGFTTLC